MTIILKGSTQDGVPFEKKFLSGEQFQEFLAENPFLEVSEFRDGEKFPKESDKEIPLTA